MRFSAFWKAEEDDKAMCTLILFNFMTIVCFESLLISGECNQMALFCFTNLFLAECFWTVECRLKFTTLPVTFGSLRFWAIGKLTSSVVLSIVLKNFFLAFSAVVEHTAEADGGDGR